MKFKFQKLFKKKAEIRHPKKPMPIEEDQVVAVWPKESSFVKN